MEAEVKALRKIGYEIGLFAAHTDTMQGDLLYPVRTAFRVATGRGRNPLNAIRNFGPDIVHIHNLFPNFGRHWVEKLSVPLIHTLHNYRPMCANGLLFRDGHICLDCPSGKRWSGIRHACYRNSVLASIPVAFANRSGLLGDPVIQRADQLILLSQRQRQLYAAAGLPESKMMLRPHFLPEELDPLPEGIHDESEWVHGNSQGWLWVGRISEEKGILKLVERWPSHETLQIVGEGDSRETLRSAARGKQIHLLGRVHRNLVLDLMKRSMGLVFPSLWYEGFPLVFLEALAAGLPILAFEPNVVHDLVREEEGIGWITDWESDLPALIEKIATEIKLNEHAIRYRCRATFERIGSEKSYGSWARSMYGSLLP